MSLVVALLLTISIYDGLLRVGVWTVDPAHLRIGCQIVEHARVCVRVAV